MVMSCRFFLSFDWYRKCYEYLGVFSETLKLTFKFLVYYKAPHKFILASYILDYRYCEQPLSISLYNNSYPKPYSSLIFIKPFIKFLLAYVAEFLFYLFIFLFTCQRQHFFFLTVNYFCCMLL